MSLVVEGCVVHLAAARRDRLITTRCLDDSREVNLVRKIGGGSLAWFLDDGFAVFRITVPGNPRATGGIGTWEDGILLLVELATEPAHFASDDVGSFVEVTVVFLGLGVASSVVIESVFCDTAEEIVWVQRGNRVNSPDPVRAAVVGALLNLPCVVADTESYDNIAGKGLHVD